MSPNYQKLALRTLASTEKPIERLSCANAFGFLGNLGCNIQMVSRQADDFKRAIFYGKPPLPLSFVLIESGEERAALAEAVSRLTPQAANLLHAAIGKITEAGEFADAILKHIFHGAPLDFTNLNEEVGDGQWYDAVALDVTGSSFEEVQAKNIAKLAARYPEKFTEEKAESRDLAAERKVLESAPDGSRNLFAADDYDHSIHTNPDAKAWAAFFMDNLSQMRNNGNNPFAGEADANATEDWMHTWFANAMMAMSDFEANKRRKEEAPEITQENLPGFTAGSAEGSWEGSNASRLRVEAAKAGGTPVDLARSEDKPEPDLDLLCDHAQGYCKKEPHDAEGSYFHDKDHDGPFICDGEKRCGRCHEAL